MSIWTEEQLKRFREAHAQATCESEREAYERLAPEAFENDAIEVGFYWTKNFPCLITFQYLTYIMI